MLRVLFLTAFLALVAMPAGAANVDNGALRALAKGELAVFATDPAVIEALRQQNGRNGGMSWDEIETLDQQWQEETGKHSRPLIDRVISHPGSQRLKELKHRTRGLVTQVVVTDMHGLNVVQSDVTPTYWQGDHAVWTSGLPFGAVVVGEVAEDAALVPISLPVIDPEFGESIGAVTIFVDMSWL